MSGILALEMLTRMTQQDNSTCWFKANNQAMFYFTKEPPLHMPIVQGHRLSTLYIQVLQPFQFPSRKLISFLLNLDQDISFRHVAFIGHVSIDGIFCKVKYQIYHIYPLLVIN